MEDKEYRWLDITSAILLLSSLWLVALRMRITDWTIQLGKVEAAVLLGCIAGMVLGYSKFNKKAIRWLIFAFSFYVLSWLFSGLINIDENIAGRLVRLGRALWTAFQLFINNRPVNNSYLFLVLVILSFWFLGLSAGFLLLRYGKPWIPIILSSILLAIIDTYSSYVEGRHLVSGFYVLLILVLLGRVYFVQSQRQWEKRGAMVDFGLGFDLGRTMAVYGLVLVAISWSVPSVIQMFIPGTPSNARFSDVWEPFREKFSNIVSDLRSPRSNSSNYFRDQMTLGTQAAQGESPIFRVVASADRAPGMQFYWRAYSYDTYDEGRWSSTVGEDHDILVSYWPIYIPEWQARQRIDLRINVFVSGSTLVSPGYPLSFNIPITMNSQDLGEETGFNDIAFRAEKTLRRGDEYRVSAWVAYPTVKELEEAGLNYPAWVTDTYLQLPEDFSEQVRDLAGEITSDEETPFDKTMAVTRYLREEITYSTSISSPPANADLIEWFLFNQKQGYCNYYATAEVLMLRSVGIPARLSVGYAEGVETENDKTFQVNFNNTHAWPEVFFPSYGWVEFEPTVSQPISSFLPERNDLGDEQIDEMAVIEQYLDNGGESYGDEGVGLEDISSLEVQQKNNKFLIFLYVLIGVFVVGSTGYLLQRYTKIGVFHPSISLENWLKRKGATTPKWLENMSRRARLTPVEKYFHEVEWMFRLLGKNTIATQTPTERMQILVSLIPDASEPAFILLGEYEKTIYSLNKGNVLLANGARAMLWKKVFRYWLKRNMGRFVWRE